MDYQIYKDGSLVGLLVDIESKDKNSRWQVVSTDKHTVYPNTKFDSMDSALRQFESKTTTRISLFGEISKN
mgnify:CR=1 FL=1|jgi:hypothetical protein